MRSFATRLLNDRLGAAVTEFGLFAAVATMLLVAGMTVVGGDTRGLSHHPVSVALR